MPRVAYAATVEDASITKTSSHRMKKCSIDPVCEKAASVVEIREEGIAVWGILILQAETDADLTIFEETDGQ